MSLVGVWNLPRRLAVWGAGSATFVACLVILTLIRNDTSEFDFGAFINDAALSAIAGLIAFTFIQWLVSTKHRILSRMAWNNLTRRKRNTALVIVGLLVGSAIVSSSLVIGDSLDATMEAQFLTPLGEVDIVIEGADPATGSRTEWSEERADLLAVLLRPRDDVDGVRSGLRTSSSVLNPLLLKGEPNVVWYAMDANSSDADNWPDIGGDSGLPYSSILDNHILINTELADSTGAKVGDSMEVHWNTLDLTTGMHLKAVENFTVQAIVDNVDTGHTNSRDALMFTTLSQAQVVLEKEGLVNHFEISATGTGTDSLVAEEGLVPVVWQLLNQTLTAEESGLAVESDESTGMFAIARTTGFGVLSPYEINSLVDNASQVSEVATYLTMLQVPVYNIAQDGVNLSGLASSSISEITFDGEWDWYATAAGLSLQAEDGRWFVWTPDDADDDGIADILPLDVGRGLIAHQQGIRLIDLAEGVEDENLLVGADIVGLAGDASNAFAVSIADGDANLLWQAAPLQVDLWSSAALPDSGSVVSADIAVDATELHIMIERLLGTRTCSIPLSTFSTNTVDAATLAAFCSEDASAARTVFEHGDVAWLEDGTGLYRIGPFSSARIPATSLGLPAGELVSSSQNVVWVDDNDANTSELWAYDGLIFSAISTPLSDVAVAGAIALDNGRLAVTTGHGVTIHEDGEWSGRLPYTIRIDAINRVPLSVVAFEGGEAIGMPSPPEGAVLISEWAGSTLALEIGDDLRVRGYLPAARGLMEGEILMVANASLSLASPPGQPSFADITLGVVHLTDAEALAAGNEGERSAVMIASNTFGNQSAFAELEAAVHAWADEISTTNNSHLGVTREKHHTVQDTENAGEGFSMLFLIFGTFVIFAGVLLVVNIFVMLSDERKPEMGMARAIGMQRGDLRSLFVQEGALLGLISCAVGSVLGIGVAKILMTFMDVAFQDTLGWQVVFNWEFSSIVAGFSTGFLVTWATLWLTSVYVSRLNVVAAMRGIPIRLKDGLPWWSILVTFALFGAAMCCVAISLLFGDAESGSKHAWWLAGGFLILLALVPPAFMLGRAILPEDISIGRFRFHRPVVLPRLVMSILGISMFMWAWMEDPIRAEWEQGPYSFIVLGLFLVAAGVLLLTSLAPVIARMLAKAGSSFSGRLASVLPTSLSYPLASPFRTSMTMGMFSLVVFAVVVLSGYSGMFGSFLADLGEEASGDFEIILVGSELDLSADVTTWDIGNASLDEFDAVAVINSATVKAQSQHLTAEGGDDFYLALHGIDDNFSQHGGLGLRWWSDTLGDTQAEAWQAVVDSDDLIIIDPWNAQDEFVGERGLTYPGLGVGIGSAVTLSDPLNPGVNRTFYVAGVMSENASIMMNGVLMNRSVAAELFDAEPNMAWFSVPEGTSIEEQQRLEDEIQRGMIDEGGTVFTIAVAFAKAQSFILSIFSLLKAFLGLGLAVGIAGLAVVTIRNVSERRHQIGILRAIGFQRGMVVASFLIELSWVSLLGILNGASIGIAFHWSLYKRFIEPEGGEFMMPWAEVTAVVLGAYLLTLLATIWPVRLAAQITPAEALREVV
jgi:putative ABC transport system permease protein